MSDGFRSVSTKGGKWGCAVMTLICAPLFFFLVLVDALGDCMPDVECHKGFIRNVALPTALVGLVIYFAIRTIVNWVDRRNSAG
jgi:hypothetical protein